MAKSRVPNSGDETVTFRKSDAQRIANTVHAYESGRRPRNSSVLPRAPGGGGGGGVAEAFYTGGWLIGVNKQITFTADTNATAYAINKIRSIPIASGGLQFRNCTVAPAVNGDATYILLNSEC